MKPSCYSLPINVLLPSKTFLRTHRCFLVSLFLCSFHFHRTLFRGHAGASVNPESFFQTLYSLFFFVK